MGAIKAWKFGDTSAPSFPTDFEIVQKAVLQVTDIKNNNNKYYAIELHQAGPASFRVFTHYGRTDDLEMNPDAGQKECRYFSSLGEAQACYQHIYREKTSARKGYKEVALASTKIGSTKARGTSSGDVDAATLARIHGECSEESSSGGKGKGTVKPASSKPAGSKLKPLVQELVRYIYDEAKNKLTSTIQAKITANGIETPLGILTLGQIQKGETILMQLYQESQRKSPRIQTFERLSGEFYTAIPHRIGRTRAAIASAVISNLEAIEQKQSTLQLMRDMLQVNGEGGNVLFNAQVDQEYEALGCEIDYLDTKDAKFAELSDYVKQSLVKRKSCKIRNIYTLKRSGEWKVFKEAVGNHRLLFHGSRIQNWVGILSRGILMPKIVVSMGVRRTDAGWLGNGIYFGDAACTSLFYATSGRRRTRFLSIARVALGKSKQYHKITFGLSGPPQGYDSCHGVRRKTGTPSEFDDDEYVIYTTEQQRLEYLIEVED